MALDLTYQAVLKQIERFTVKGGTESRAFLAWFLENYYRLDETEIYDAVCDGHGDKGIDGIYVNEQLRRIDVFQVTVFKAEDKKLGDAKLKQLAGALLQLSTAQSATQMLRSANAELKAIAKALDLVARIEQGFEIKGVFVTNGNADVSATSYPQYHYRIKRGEHPEWNKDTVIENELLARIVLAFDLNRHETWSHNYRLFDDLHAEIFGRPELNADRVMFLYDAYTICKDALDLLDDKLFAQYTLTRWLAVLLLKEALLTDESGQSLYKNPSDFIAQPKDRGRLQLCIGNIGKTIMRLLNGLVKRRKEKGFFDYKNLLKNREAIIAISTEIIPQYEVMIDGSLAKSFADQWNDSKGNAKG